MDTDIFIAHVNTDGIYKHIADDVHKRGGTSISEIERPFSKGKKNLEKSNWINLI